MAAFLSVYTNAEKAPGTLTGPRSRHAHLDDGHAHEPEQAAALLIVLLRDAHRALAVFGHIRLAARLPKSAQEGSCHSASTACSVLAASAGTACELRYSPGSPCPALLHVLQVDLDAFA